MSKTAHMPKSAHEALAMGYRRNHDLKAFLGADYVNFAAKQTDHCAPGDTTSICYKWHTPGVGWSIGICDGNGNCHHYTKPE